MELERELGGKSVDLKCLLARGSQERADRVIRFLSTLALIWKLFDLDLGLLEREPNCSYPLGSC